MFSYQNKELFYNQISQLRTKVIELSKGKIKDEQVQLIEAKIIQIRSSIQQYIEKISKDIDKLKNKQQNLQILTKTLQGKYQNQKIFLYLWQIINFVIINSTNIQQQLLIIISTILNGSIKYQFCFSPNTIKNGLISIHNFIANAIKSQTKYINYELEICEWIQQILVYYFHKQQPQNIYFKDNKTQQNHIAETEWIAYIFKQLFSNTYYKSNQLSFIQQFTSKSKNQMIGYYIIHMVGNHFQDSIDKRVTTELVSGYQCKITDIKQMYTANDTILVSFKISKYDLQFICKSLKRSMQQYIQLVVRYLKNKISKQQFDLNQFNEKWGKLSDIIQQIIHVLNCILFIGGYNHSLQDQIIQELLEKGKEILNYFQISYLLYRNIEATKYKSKVSLVVEMEKEAKSKLLKIAEIQSINIEQIDIKALSLDKILAKGQLVSLLRLLSNLVHINKRAQYPFQQEVKYLHMILSLTHDSISQVTMKQWAIMFIRNVAQWSEKLRQQISNIKIQMKVE